MIIVGDLQPLEGLVRFAAPQRKPQRSGTPTSLCPLATMSAKRRVRGRSIPSRVMCKGEFETPIAFVRLKLSFAQSRLAITTQDRHDDLPSVVACGGRLQFCSFARCGIGLVEFSLNEKNAGQIPSR